MTDTLETTLSCRTGDGIQLALRRIVHRGGSPRGPLILQHGLGSNGMVFDYPGRSLARHLAARGFECYVTELRGTGGSERPREPWGLDEYLTQDVPALIAAVQRASGRERVRWVGHSMGGILAMCYGIEHPEAPIERFVAVGSALDYRPGYSVFRDQRKLRPLVGDRLDFLPFDLIARANGLIAGRGPIALPPEDMNFVRSNVEPEIIRAILSRGFSPIPMRLFADLDTTFDAHGLSRAGGTIRYLEQAEKFRVPGCLLVGSGDVQCSMVAVRETARVLSGSPSLEVVGFGRPHGHADDYGHFDLIVGRRAQQEVWPTIVRCLETA